MALNAGSWFAWRWAAQPPDEDHHYGHGNGEAVASLLIGLVIIATGVGIVWAAFAWEGHTAVGLLGLASIAAEVVNIGVKLWLAKITRAAGVALRSPALIALARDNATDVYASGLVLFGVAASVVGIPWLEPIVTVVLGLLVAKLGLESAREGFDVLMDRIDDPEMRDRIVQIALSVEGVKGVDHVRIHPLGPSLRVDMELRVSGEITVAQGHDIAHDVEDAVVAAEDRVGEVHVHINPWVEEAAPEEPPLAPPPQD